MIRAFLAIDLPASLRSVLSSAQEELKQSGADVKWVKPENIHLTLKFLGNVPLDKIETIGDVLKQTAEQFPQFSFKLCELGAFPRIQSPRVIWFFSFPLCPS